MSKLTIAVCMPDLFCDQTVARLKVKRPEMKFLVIDHKTLRVDSEMKLCTVLFVDPHILNELIPQMPNLQYVQSTWAGVERFFRSINLDPNFKCPGWKFCRMAMYGPVLAEFVIGQILSWERRFLEIDKNRAAKIWDQRPFVNYRPLSALVVGILGLGSAGSEVARTCKLFGTTVHGLQGRKASSSRTSCVDIWRSQSELQLLLSECDYLVNVLPSTPDTRNLLGNDILKNCKCKQPIFINIGRGDIISEKELITALDKGYLGGATLDVFETEPLPQDSQLWSNSKVVITPHVAGVYMPSLCADYFLKNLSRFEAGDALLGEVDFSLGY